MAKELTWLGKSEEEVKKMDLKEFAALIPSRRRRSLNRGFTDQQKILLNKLEQGQKSIKTHCREMVILPSMIGQTISVYTGKAFVPVTVTIEMMGHLLGEFAPSRKMVSHSSAGVGATRSSKAVSAR
jgi:small subunit ribosomal protein S19